jgi:hypothetical protein
MTPIGIVASVLALLLALVLLSSPAPAVAIGSITQAASGLASTD